jgi:hypothetical protein
MHSEQFYVLLSLFWGGGGIVLVNCSSSSSIIIIIIIIYYYFFSGIWQFKNLLIVSVTFNKTEILVRVCMTAENI